MLLLTPLCAAKSAPWLTDVALRQQLQSPLGVTWHGAPLAYALSGIANTQHVAILRDRRIDPDQEVTLAIDGKPLGEAFAALANHLKCGYSQFGPVAYLGPVEVSERLRSLAALRADEAQALPEPVREKLLLLRTWQWNDLAEPRLLLDELATEAGLQVVNPERIPHDLWRAGDLPLLSWIDRATLLTAQFGLTFRFLEDGRRLELVEIPDEVLVARSYAGGRSARNLARRWQRELPGARFEVEDNEIVVLATVEDHEQVEQRLRGAPTKRARVTKGPQVYKLTVEKTALDALVDRLANDLALDVQWDRDATAAAGVASNQLVSFQVDGANLDQLLEAVFAGTGLKCHRVGKRVLVSANR